jgi:hypothetical protein
MDDLLKKSCLQLEEIYASLSADFIESDNKLAFQKDLIPFLGNIHVIISQIFIDPVLYCHPDVNYYLKRLTGIAKSAHIMIMVNNEHVYQQWLNHTYREQTTITHRHFEHEFTVAVYDRGIFNTGYPFANDFISHQDPFTEDERNVISLHYKRPFEQLSTQEISNSLFRLMPFIETVLNKE